MTFGCLGWTTAKIPRERQALRPLTKAVFRYASPASIVTDGAIFAFVVGTDAEVLLCWSARAEECNAGSTRWRASTAVIAAYHKDRSVARRQATSKNGTAMRS